MSALTPAVFHVLVALATDDRHGYGIMQDVREQTADGIRMGAGTLYGTLDRLMGAGWVREVNGPSAQTVRDERRRFYRLTPRGREALEAEIDRLEGLLKIARAVRRAAKART